MSRNQDFLRGTERQQVLVVNIAAAGVIAVVAVVIAAAVWIYPRYDRDDALKLSVDVPYVGPGVAAGTKVILRGAEIGEVSELEKTDGGPVRMSLALRPEQIHGLTDSFDLDFRPQNYFGITAINLEGRPGGNDLVNDQVLSMTPTGDFTMSRMLEEGSLIVDGTLTKSMVTTLDKVIRYTDGLTPLVQTGIVVADRVAQTQQALPSDLMDYINGILEVLPAFSSQGIEALYNMFDNKFNRLPDGSFGVTDSVVDRADQGLNLAANNVFGAAGKLLASHGAELTPMTEIVQAISGGLPSVLAGGEASDKLTTLVERYDRAFTGPDDKKTLNLRLVLDELPMLGAPLAVAGPSQPSFEEVPK